MAASEVNQIPLAIVGMACRLPGADDLDSYWRMLIEGRTGVGEIPPDHFDRELYYDPKRGTRTKSYTTVGGVVRRRRFDRDRCPLPLDLIEQSHDVHLMLCEVAAEACRNAGLDAFSLPTRNVGVYVGHTPPNIVTGDVTFARRVAETAQFLREVDGFNALTGGRQDAVIREVIEAVRGRFETDDPRLKIGSNAYHAASLIARGFRLNGPSISFDAACASSLRALGHAVRALQLGQIEMAIVGSASLCCADTLVVFSQAQTLSTRDSRPFDQNADGLVASEGYLCIVIKPLERAIADADEILAVIRGVGVSSDGKGKSLWAPRKEGQIEAMRRAYGPEISFEELQYIEMHATSTQLGDATEMSALVEMLGGRVPRSVKIPVGTAKANVGHTLESAGLVSIVKAVLAMRHGVIPPQINVQSPTDKIDWASIPFYLPKEPLAWQPPAGIPRRAAVNAFGIGGLNVHVVLDDSAPTRHAAAPVAARGKNEATPNSAGLAGSAKRGALEPIAIVGAGAVFPGARTIDALLDLVRDGGDQSHDLPMEPWTQYVDVDSPEERGWRIRYRRAATITDFEYDWKKHKVPPKQVADADPLQFMLLDATDQALRDAGCDGNAIDRKRTGVIVGTVFGSDFTDQLSMGLRLPEFQQTLAEILRRRGIGETQIGRVCAEYENVLLKHMPALIDQTGSFTSSTLASRIAKTFDLMGGAVAVDAGGASAMAALGCCVDMLRAGDCDMMLCASGQREMGCSIYAKMFKDALLSPDGSTGPFDADSAGCIPGECVGVLLLKRLSDARRDGDRIRGIIHHIGAGQDESLENAMRTAVSRAFCNSTIRPGDVVLIESAAIGVASYDRPEIEAIAGAYGERKEPVLLSAASAQFGYLGGGSGMASLLRAIAQLNDTTLPKLPNFRTPVAEIRQCAGLLCVPTTATRLPALNDDGRMLAGVNAFSDRNLAYHVVIEGATRVAQLPTRSASPSGSIPTVMRTDPGHVSRGMLGRWQITRIGARSYDCLMARLSAESADPAGLFGRAAANEFHTEHCCRLAIVAAAVDELKAKLELASAQLANASARPLLAEKGILYGEPVRRPRVAFLFPGEGSQHEGMLRQLVEEFPPAAAAMCDVDSVLNRYGLPAFREIAWEGRKRSAADTREAKVALVAADWIMYRAVEALGLRPHCVAGHGFGEVVALIAADSWDLERALQVTLARCAAIETNGKSGGAMLSTSAPAEILEELCRWIPNVSISHFNAPDQTVAAGRASGVKQLARILADRKYHTRLLDMSIAFHTPLMEGMQAEFARGIAEAKIDPARIPLLSSVSSRYVADPEEIRANLVEQMRAPIRYTDLARRLAEDGINIFVEVGPNQVLTGLHKRIFNGSIPALVSCDHKTHGGLQQLCRVVACLDVHDASNPGDLLAARFRPTAERRSIKRHFLRDEAAAGVPSQPRIVH